MGLLSRIRSKLTPPSYNSDGMKLYSRTLDFRSDPRFIAAYRRGMNSGHVIQRSAGSTKDIGIDYRAYMECWAAQHGLHLKGDFVWCGVNTGIYSLAACDYTDINSSEKSIWLFDTYEGIPADQISPAERAKHREVENVMYPECYQLAKKNFADFRNAKLVRGKVPDSLSTVSIDHVAYLSIDMNITYPERKAIEHFWPKLSSGAIVILDDYGFTPYVEQKLSMDEFAKSVGVAVCTLPTGQGMIIKP